MAKASAVVKCPECASPKIWKNGLRRAIYGDVQRYLCKDCGFRFSRSGKRHIPYKTSSESFECSRICVSPERKAKNLAIQKPRSEDGHAGATRVNRPNVKGELIEFAWWMKKQGYSESSIKTYTNALELLLKRGARLDLPEIVKEVLVGPKWTQYTRHDAIAAYTLFLRKLDRTWKPPINKVARKIPFIPTEQEIDTLIAACGKKTATLLKLLKETGIRVGEACRLEWTDIDLVRKTITLNTPEKNGKPRIFNVSNKLIEMLNALPKKTNEVIGGRVEYKHSTFYISRKRAAAKLKNPRLTRITFHTLRHWKATMLYHQTKDILYVKEFLGHKSIEATLLYIQLAEHLFRETMNEYHCKTATTVEETKKLAEAGFEYFTTIQDVQIFRKRK